MTAVDEVSTTRENDDQTTTSSEKLVTPMDTPVPLGESTHRTAESTPGPRGTPDTVRTRASGRFISILRGGPRGSPDIVRTRSSGRFRTFLKDFLF